MTDPRRLLDEGSEASPALRALLASAKRLDDPRASQIGALSARLAASVEPLARTASMTPAPHMVAAAVASAGRAATWLKAGAVLIALGVLCAGALYVRAIRDDARTHAETRRAIERDARQLPPPAAPRSPDDGSQDHALPGNGSPGNGSPGNGSQDHALPDNGSPDNVVPQPLPTPSRGSANAPPRSATSARQKPGSDDGEADPDAEAKLVLAAGAALVRDDAEAALALTRRHLTQFPDGAHAEERDRIAIEAQARLGGLDEARAAADRFFLRYPQSIYRPRIESLLQ